MNTRARAPRVPTAERRVYDGYSSSQTTASFLDRYRTLGMFLAMTPAPAIDEALHVMGGVPDEYEISAWLKAERIDDSRAGTA